MIVSGALRKWLQVVKQYAWCVQGTREITRWILGYGGEVEVLESESLRAAVAARGRRMAAM